jgi:hypothetical protein
MCSVFDSLGKTSHILLAAKDKNRGIALFRRKTTRVKGGLCFSGEALEVGNMRMALELPN